MSEHDDVRELLGSYVLGHLSGEDEARVEAVLARDAELRAEADELRSVADLLPLLSPDDLEVDGAPEPPEGIEAAVLARLSADGGTVDGSEVVPLGGRHAPRAARQVGGRTARLVSIAATLVLVVAAVGVGVLLQGEEAAPGLGVAEPIAFDVAQDAVTVDASLVPHTWGTEVFLTMEGLVDGETYLVEIQRADGERVSAGTFLGDADLEVVCVLNGAVLREDAVAIVVTTRAGELVMRADLDAVAYRSV